MYSISTVIIHIQSAHGRALHVLRHFPYPQLYILHRIVNYCMKQNAVSHDEVPTRKLVVLLLLLLLSSLSTATDLVQFHQSHTCKTDENLQKCYCTRPEVLLRPGIIIHIIHHALASTAIFSRSLSRLAATVFASALRRSRIPLMASVFCTYNQSQTNYYPKPHYD